MFFDKKEQSCFVIEYPWNKCCILKLTHYTQYVWMNKFKSTLNKKQTKQKNLTKDF